MPEYEKDRLKASNWARKLINGDFGEWCILDTETTGLYGAVPIEICVISKHGSSMINTRIKPLLPIEPGAKAVHGISEEDLAECPTFADIYPRLKEVLEDKLVIIYNADFDTSVLFNAIRLHKLPRIKFRSDCAMVQYAAYVGEWSSYWGNYKWQKLPGRRSHTARGDCIDTLNLIKKMADNPEEKKPVTYINHKLFPPYQIGCKWEPCLRLGYLLRDYEEDDYIRWHRTKEIYIKFPKFYKMTDKDVQEVIFNDDRD